jgi:hypothetical protein
MTLALVVVGRNIKSVAATWFIPLLRVPIAYLDHNGEHQTKAQPWINAISMQLGYLQNPA